MIRARAGFTLIEVITALGVFTIAFLSGFAAIAVMMQQMQLVYRNTVAASAAMVVLPKFDAARALNPFLEPLKINPGLRFYGGPVDAPTESEVNAGAAQAFIFKDGTVQNLDLRVYNRDLVVVVSSDKNSASMWSAPIYSGGNNNSGGRNLFRDGSTRDARCDFLGLYDIPAP